MPFPPLDSPEALAFLHNEFEKESPEIAATCVEPILLSSSEKVLDLLLAGFAKRPRPVKLEVLAQFAKTKRDLTPVESTLIGILNTEAQPEVRKELPAVVGRIQTVAAAKALLGSISGREARPDPRGKGKAAGGDAQEYARRVLAALKETKSDAVKAWLAGEAFAGAPPSRAEVLFELAGELKLEAARAELEKHLDSPDDRIAIGALGALVKLGPAPSAPKIQESLGKAKRGLTFKIEALDTLAASGNAAGVTAVVDAARDGDPETRTIALGSLARVPGANESAVQGILAGLRDGDPGARGAALRALRFIRHKQMVPALIALLGSEKDEKLKIEALQLLLVVTGKNMGLVAEDWQKWWEVSQDKFEFVKGDLKAATASQSRDLKYFGIEISSKRLGFLLDNSGSMKEEVDVYLLTPEQKKAQEKAAGGTQVPAGAEGKDKEGKDGKAGEEEKKKSGPKTRARKIDVLKKEMARVVGELPRDTQLNIVTFAANYKAWQETLQPLAGGGREKAQAFIKDMATSSGTNVFDTLEFALRDKRVDTIFLLTDGLPTAGRHTDKASILREVQALNRLRGVVINCIAFGEESDFLKELAKQNGGVYRFVNSY